MFRSPTIVLLLLGIHRPTAGHAGVAGRDSWADPVAAHRHVAYIASEPTLWPGLTGTETLDYLANLHGGCDRAYRDVLVERFDFDQHQKIRALSKGQPPEGPAGRGIRHPRRRTRAR